MKDLLLLSIDDESEVQYKFLYQNYLKIISNNSNADWNQIYCLLNESHESLRNNTNLSLELYYLLFNVRYCLSGNKHYRFRSKLINYINV